MVKMN